MTETLTVAPWRVFHAEVRAVRRLSPSFVRVTLTGPDLDRFADNGYDQRFKLLLPLPGEQTVQMPEGPDWYAQWRALPDDRRYPMRTYTVRAVRPQVAEVDVDLVVHGDNGPASRWALHARPGDELALVGPDVGYHGDHGGVEFRPPAGAKLLLAGDETAVPAIAAILERLPPWACGRALLEVPDARDVLPLVAPAGVTLTWLPRDRHGHEDGNVNGHGYGSRLVPAVVAAAGDLLDGRDLAVGPMAGGQAAADGDVDAEILWEVPEEVPEVPLYAWLAGEAGVIRTLRRHLVGERGLDRSAVAFMGYWRLGRADPA